MTTRSQIVATIGPATGTPEMVEKLINAGMNIARLNFSHGTHESHTALINAIREGGKRAGVYVPIIQDLSGPRMSTDDGHAFDENKAEITEKDLSDLEFGIGIGIDFVAHSYVGSRADVDAMRAEITKRGSKLPIIAKIERQEAVDNFSEILAAADAIMIARGDLGLAVPIENIPFIERDIIAGCNAAGKPVIVATQMMLTMTESPIPTRAEVTDVAYAVMMGTDATMLSEESALGKYPVEVVSTMAKVATRSMSERKVAQINALTSLAPVAEKMV